MTCVQISRRCVQNFVALVLSYVIDLSDKITHMTMKIAVSPEYDYEKRHFHSNRLILILLQKELTALSDTFFSFWRIRP